MDDVTDDLSVIDPWDAPYVRFLVYPWQLLTMTQPINNMQLACNVARSAACGTSIVTKQGAR